MFSGAVYFLPSTGGTCSSSSSYVNNQHNRIMIQTIQTNSSADTNIYSIRCHYIYDVSSERCGWLGVYVHTTKQPTLVTTRTEPKFFWEEDIRDVITCFKCGDDRFRGIASAEGQILPFPIDSAGRPYNTLTLP